MTNLVSAVDYSDCTIYGNCKPTNTGGVVNINYSSVNTNNSQYLQGYTPANFWKTSGDQTGLTGVKSGSYVLADNSNIDSIRPWSRNLVRSDGTAIFSWETGTMVGLENQNSINWVSRTLHNSTGDVVWNWETTPFPTTPVSDWIDNGTGYLYPKNITNKVLVGTDTEDGSLAEFQINGAIAGSADVATGTVNATPTGSFSYNGYAFDFQIYSFKDINGTITYSQNYLSLPFTDMGSGVITDGYVSNTGSGYTDGDLCTIQSGNYNAIVQIIGDGSGGVASVIIINGGTGYSNSNSYYISSCNLGSNSDATYYVTTTSSSLNYDLNVSWQPVPNADGYKILIYDGFNGYWYDKNITTDALTTEIIYTTTYLVGTDVTITPTAPTRAGSFQGDVSINGYLNMNNKNINNGVNVVDSNFIGSGAGYQATGATSSNFFGYNSGFQASNSSTSNFIGYNSGYQASSVTNGNYFGNGAGYQATGTISSNFIGTSAGANGYNTEYSNFIGSQAGQGASTASFSNFIGNNAGNGATGAGSSNFLGDSAGTSATSSIYSNFIGSQAGQGASGSYKSNFIGNNAGNGATVSGNANYIGTEAGYQATQSEQTNFIGQSAGSGVSQCYGSNMIGINAGKNGNNDYYSNFIGQDAGYSSTGSYRSNFIGISAGTSNTNSFSSNFIGDGAGGGSTASRSNIIGVSSGTNMPGATRVNFIGDNAGNKAKNSSDGIAIGSYAGSRVSTVAPATIPFVNYTFIGTYAGYNSTTATNSIFIGTSAGAFDSVNNGANGVSIAIGRYSGTCGFSNSTAIGRGVCNSKAQQMNLGNVIKIDGIYNSDTQSNVTINTANTTIGGNVNVTENLIVTGNLSYKNAYGNFLDNTTQSLISTTAGQPMNFSITTDNYLVNMIGKQNITVLREGDYEFIVSAIGYSTADGADKTHINIWFQKNGVNVPNSNTKIQLGLKEEEADIVVPFIIDLNSTDKMRVMWNGDNAFNQLLYITNTSFIPATPSVILTVKRIGDITS